MKKKPERLILRLELHSGRAGLFAADEFTRARMKEKGFRIGDELSAELRKARNPKFHRLAHQLGRALIENTDDFQSYTDPHAVLKRLQLETGAQCDSTLIKAPGLGMLEHRVPRSLSFESMDESDFKAFYAALCDYVIKTYWRGFTPEQVEEVGSLVGMSS